MSEYTAVISNMVNTLGGSGLSLNTQLFFLTWSTHWVGGSCLWTQSCFLNPLGGRELSLDTKLFFKPSGWEGVVSEFTAVISNTVNTLGGKWLSVNIQS